MSKSVTGVGREARLADELDGGPNELELAEAALGEAEAELLAAGACELVRLSTEFTKVANAGLWAMRMRIRRLFDLRAASEIANRCEVDE